MNDIFEEIKQTVHGVIGSYLMDRKGEMLANDVPSLFKDELVSVSQDMYQLVDIVKSERPVNNIRVRADQGYIHLYITENFILGTFASKHADESLLSQVVGKAVMNINPADFMKAGGMHAPERIMVDDDVRAALCQAVKGKIKIMYGDKMAETTLREAFDKAGARRNTRNKEELTAVFDILATGLMAKMMGKEKARTFVEDLYKEHGLK